MATLKYNGKHNSGTFAIGQVFFAIIGIGALFAFFSLADFDDIGDYGWELFFIFLMGASTLYGIFRKKAKTVEMNISVHEEGIQLLQIGKIPFDQVHLDIYADKTTFYRYHLWDDAGKLAIYAIYNDELVDVLSKKPIHKREFIEFGSESNEEDISVECEGNHSLAYDLDSGSYTFWEGDKSSDTIIPEYVIWDPKFQLVT
ncbi:MAG: hypothetical protein JXR07_15450 [Reichenbachiella sp.]